MRLTDHRKLPYVKIDKPDQPFHFEQTSHDHKIKSYLDSLLPETRTAAFLVIKDDTIIYERYFNGFERTSLLPSNSMTKSFTSTLATIALQEGRIVSFTEPITNYLPELLKRDSNFKKITIQHLLDMRSGLKFREGKYDLKDDAIKLSFRPNIEKHLLRPTIAQPPGSYRYQSINTQLLGLIVERATGQPLYTYLEEKLWKPLGSESHATWNMDSKKRKQVIMSAGLNATARDFAKLGRLYLKNGLWDDKEIISVQWVNTVNNIDTMQAYRGYKNQWWSRMASYSFQDSLNAVAFKNGNMYADAIRKQHEGYRVRYRTEAFSAVGFMNQIIYVHPRKKLIIVRLGHRWISQDSFTQFIHNLGENYF